MGHRHAAAAVTGVAAVLAVMIALPSSDDGSAVQLAALPTQAPPPAAERSTQEPDPDWEGSARELAALLARTDDLDAQALADDLDAAGFPAEPQPDDADRPPRTSGGRADNPGGRVVELTEGTQTVDVEDDDQLATALADAAPGDVITLAPGTYEPVIITGAGTADEPITLTGPADAIFAGEDRGYTVHVEDAAYWQLVGFSVTGGGKGIVIDNGQSLLLDSLSVGRTGEEAVHFRSGSSDNILQRSHIHDTGLGKPQFGEGVYVGSARSNWDAYGTDGGPDLSMNNQVLSNTFEQITAENVDIKEETGGTVVAGNAFDGSAISGENYADSVVDIKGYDAQVIDNVTTGESPELGNIIETHVITDPDTSGCGNAIERNTVEGFEPAGELVAVDKKCDEQ